MEILLPEENPGIMLEEPELLGIPVRVSPLVPPDQLWIHEDGRGLTVFVIAYPGKGYKIAYENALIEDWWEVWI